MSSAREVGYLVFGGPTAEGVGDAPRHAAEAETRAGSEEGLGD